MVEYMVELDKVFGSLSDPTRRDILRRVATREMSVGEIAEDYQITFAAVAKHLKVLERAHLIGKNKRGKEQIVTINPQVLSAADQYLENYRGLWEAQLDALDAYLHSRNR
jgi:DNA-binding transcriptional ArsR family regulator